MVKTNKLSLLIIGSSGFIGRNLVENFPNKYNLLLPKHKELELTDEKAVEDYFKKNQIDIVVHGANIGGTRKTLNLKNTASINLRMFFNLIRCNNYYKKMIFFGSGAEYDKRNDLIKVKESDFNNSIPAGEYGFYKYICSRFIEKTENIVSLRLFGIYGKYEDYEIRFISNAICKMLFDLPITINQNVFFDYLYINDLVRIIDYFIQHKPKHKFYNVGCGQPIDLLSIAKIILKISRKKLPVKILKPGLNNEYTCNTSRLLEEIPNFKYTVFEKSIKELINYYQSILPTLNKESLLKY